MNDEQRMSAVITRLFARFQGIYGTSFTMKFSTGVNSSTGIDDGWENAKSVWSQDLASYVDRLEVIADALRYVDPDRPPSSRQFLQICHEAAKHAELRNPQKAIPYVPNDNDIERIKRAAELAVRSVGASSQDDLAWARKPKSQMALDLVVEGSKQSKALRSVLDHLIDIGIASTTGKLLKRYAGIGQWNTV